MSRQGSGGLGGGGGGGISGQHGTRHQRPIYSILTTTPSPFAVQPPPGVDSGYDDDEDGVVDSIFVDQFVSAPTGNGGSLMDNLLPTARPTREVTPPMMSMAVLMLIIVASLSAVVGAIYLLIYFKSIKPMSARSRSYADPGGGKGDDEGGARKSAGHPFFRRK